MSEGTPLEQFAQPDAETIRPAGKLRAMTLAVLIGLLVFGVQLMLLTQDRNKLVAERQRVALNMADGEANQIIQRLNGALSATYALAAVLRQHDYKPDYAWMEPFVLELLRYHPGTSNLQFSPNGITSYIVPLAGNEKAIGNNLLVINDRNKEALLAVKSRRLTLAGPFELRQGGTGLVGRLPVFKGDGKPDDPFWGFAVALMRVDQLLKSTDIARIEREGYDYLLWRLHPDTGVRHVFSSSGPADLPDSVTYPFEVINGTWNLTLQPRKGWLSGAEDEYATRLALALLIAGFAGWLSFRQLRQPDLLRAEVTRRTAALTLANQLLDEENRQRKDAEKSLRLAASVFTHAREGITITDRDANIVEVNQAFATITGYRREEVLGKNPRMLSSGRQDKDFYFAMWQALQTKGHWSGEIWNRRKDGNVFAEMLTVSAVRGEDGEIQNFIGLFTDITAMKEQQSRLEHLAHFDALTGLPNRLLLADRLHQAMRQAPRRRQRVAVAYLDLDLFKAINDTCGHAVGDRLLIALGKRMSGALREVDTLARIGGDEFVAVLVDLDDAESSAPLLNRLLEAAAKPVKVGDLELQVSTSIGVSFYPQHEEIDADQLVRQADQAMYQAKQSGRNRYHLFDAEQDRRVRGRHESLEHIRMALRNGEFILHYQPKVDMLSGEILGAEALIRWQHPERGLLSPAVFLPVIENHALSIDLGRWVIDAALTQIEAWHAEGLALPVSVNVSALQLQHPDFVPSLRALLADHPSVKPGELELEVLETSALEDFSSVTEVMRACQEMGVAFAVDDFGTGYSSLTYLKQLSATLLKIDQSFVRDMLDDPDDLAILEGVMGLATAFRRQVIAEGVETLAHGELLLRMGCAWGQGYAIARPMPAQDFPRWRETWQVPPAWKSIKPISRDHLPALFAAIEHRAWISAMVNFLAGMRDAPPRMDCHQCRFGNWLDNGGREMLLGGNADHPVDTLHREIHQLGIELVELKRAGQTDAAIARKPDLLHLRDQLLEQLGKLY